MKLRTGRRNTRNLYLQLGDEPSDLDPCVGLLIDDGAAAIVAEGLTSLWHLNEIKICAEIRHDKPKPLEPE